MAPLLKLGPAKVPARDARRFGFRQGDTSSGTTLPGGSFGQLKTIFARICWSDLPPPNTTAPLR